MLSVIAAGLILSTQMHFHQPQVPEVVYNRTPVVTRYRNYPGTGSAARQLPSEAANAQITVKAGDSRVSQSTLDTAVKIITQTSLPAIKDAVGTVPTQATNIVLYSSSSSYGRALQSAGLPYGDISTYVESTAGVTMGSDIWIPLFNISDEGELENVLTHELTHVVLNQMNIGDTLPTWINEGIAMRDGTTAQLQADPNGALIDMLTQEVGMLQAMKADELLPLTASENDIMDASYNVEYEDYLAVQSLINRYGLADFNTFFNAAESESVDQAFQDSFHTSMSSYENSFFTALEGQKDNLLKALQSQIGQI